MYRVSQNMIKCYDYDSIPLSNKSSELVSVSKSAPFNSKLTGEIVIIIFVIPGDKAFLSMPTHN